MKKQTAQTVEAALLFILILSFFLGCSSGSTQSDSSSSASAAPTWIHQPARTVDGGYIVYVSSNEDRSLEKAQFRAQAATLEDIANECSFAPKGTRTEDRFQERVGILYRIYVKSAVSFQDCQEAQAATDPTAIKKLANVALTDQIKRYQDELDDELDGEQEGNDESQNGTQASSTLSAGSSPSSSSGINNSTQFFVVRQQVAYAKEIVILAPPTAYPPNSPQSTQFVGVIRQPTQQIQTYQMQNPALKTSQSTWSSLPQKPAVPKMAGVPEMRSSRARMAPNSVGSNPQRRDQSRGRSQQQSGQRKRKDVEEQIRVVHSLQTIFD